MKKLLICALILFCAGCATQRLTVLRDGMDAATKSIREEHLAWAQKLHDGAALPKISDLDLQVRQQAEQAYEDLVNESRQNDK